MYRVFRVFILILPFVYLSVLLFKPDSALSQDLGRHIKTGEVILECFCVPDTNLFSYTQPNFPIINHHWLSQVIFYVLYSSLGLTSILVFKFLAVFIAFSLVFKLAFERGGSTWAGIVSIPYLYVLSSRFDSRPELFSFVFIAVFVYLIERYRQTKNIKVLLPLIVLQILWVNMHIYFIVGIGLLVLVLLERLVVTKKLNKHLIGIVLGTIGVSLINPFHLHGLLYPFQFWQNYGYRIVENQTIFFLNTFFNNYTYLVVELLSIILIILMATNFKRSYLYVYMALSFAIISAFVMVRNFPIFALITFPYAAFLARVATQKSTKDFSRSLQLTAAFLVMLFASVHLYRLLASNHLTFSYSKSGEDAVAYIKENNLKGPIFNNFDIGGYLIFELYPKERVFVDARPEAYSSDFFETYRSMQNTPDLFSKQAQKYGFQTIIFSHRDITPWAQEFLSWVTRDPTWATVYNDDTMIILVKHTPEHEALIKHYNGR